MFIYFILQRDTLRLEAGGHTPAECMRRVLCTLFSKPCALSLNWCGRNRDEKSSKKCGLKGIKISQVLFGVIRARFHTATTDVLEKAAMNWLRNARDLQGSSRARGPRHSTPEGSDGQGPSGASTEGTEDDNSVDTSL